MTQATPFEPHRRPLTGLAYRMLGSLSDAEDVVQDAFLRWHTLPAADIGNPRAYLVRIVTRLCLDHLKSARVRRETYVGPWLPEPVLNAAALHPETPGELADDISVALLLALERLSPPERAAFLLHDVFDRDFAEIAATLNRSEPACRQLAARARVHIRAQKRFPADPAEGQRLAAAFLHAAQTGNIATLTSLLAPAATLHSDGGGQRTAALNIIIGADKIARFTAGVVRKTPPAMTVTPATLNGLPGFILTQPNGDLRTIAFETADGVISAIYLVANPDKLRRVVQ